MGTTTSSPTAKERELFKAALQAVLASERAPAVHLDSKHGKDADAVLRAAASEGHPDAVSDLVKAGANAGAADGSGVTPLHIAAEWAAFVGTAKSLVLL